MKLNWVKVALTVWSNKTCSSLTDELHHSYTSILFSHSGKMYNGTSHGKLFYKEKFQSYCMWGNQTDCSFYTFTLYILTWAVYMQHLCESCCNNLSWWPAVYGGWCKLMVANFRQMLLYKKHYWLSFTAFVSLLYLCCYILAFVINRNLLIKKVSVVQQKLHRLMLNNMCAHDVNRNQNVHVFLVWKCIRKIQKRISFHWLGIWKMLFVYYKVFWACLSKEFENKYSCLATCWVFLM